MKLFKHIKERGEFNKLYMAAVENDPTIMDLNEAEPITYIGEIPVIKNSYILNSNNGIGALITKIYNKYYIVIDESFTMMSLNLKRFVLTHEIGHKECGHFEKLDGLEGLVVQLNLEYEADRYAAEMIGYSNAIKALDELIDLANKILDKSIESNLMFAELKVTLSMRRRQLMKSKK